MVTPVAKAATGTIDSLSTAIKKQRIFDTLPVEFNNEKCTLVGGKNKLVCRFDNYLFYAVGGMVRFCHVDEKHSNYRVMYSPHPMFAIESLLLNSSGTLLALIGTENVVIYNLPQTLDMSASGSLNVKSYILNNIGGNIKKVLWNPIVENDSAVVILNDRNEIKCYDISMSLDRPQVSLNVKNFKNFPKDQSVSTICFGSSVNLAGALTLYVCSSSKIFAIYPFIHRNARLALTRDRIIRGFEESRELVQMIENKFPTETLVQGLESYLKIAAIRHYEYFTDLKSKIDSAALIETRVTSAMTVSKFHIFEQNLPISFEPTLQGPIMNNPDGEIKDIEHIFSNKWISFLVLLVKVKDAVEIVYDIQTKPLLMLWHQSGDDKFTNPFIVEKPPPKPTQKSGYSKPKHGFGFIDLYEAEQKFLELTINHRNTKDENLFWVTELAQIYTLAVDLVTTTLKEEDDISVRTFETSKEHVFFRIGNNLLKANPSVWIYKYLSLLSIGDANISLPRDTKYQMLHGSNKQIGVTFIRDLVSGSGKIIQQVKYSGGHSLRIFEIIKAKRMLPTPKVCEPRVKPLVPSYNSQPLEELITEVESIKPPALSKAVNVSQGTKPLSGSIDCLTDVNKVSIEVIKQASRYNTMVINLDLVLATEIDTLKQQISKLKKVDDDKFDMEQFNLIKGKTSQVIKRQNALENRFSSIKKKISKTIQDEISSRSLKLSNAEKSWFEEINSVVKELKSDNENGLVERVRKLQVQVDAFKNEDKTIEQLSTESRRLKELETRNDIRKLKAWLEKEGELIEHVKNHLDAELKLVKTTV
jgi:nucleoporin NUP82